VTVDQLDKVSYLLWDQLNQEIITIPKGHHWSSLYEEHYGKFIIDLSDSMAQTRYGKLQKSGAWNPIDRYTLYEHLPAEFKGQLMLLGIPP
jgi:hypothetical protein